MLIDEIEKTEAIPVINDASTRPIIKLRIHVRNILVDYLCRTTVEFIVCVYAR